MMTEQRPPPAISRGAIYLATGEKYIAEARVSQASLKKFGVESTLLEQDGLARATLGGKSRMYSRSPYESTVFLDTDTVVLGDLTFGFEMAERHGIAMTIAPACYARRRDPEIGDAIEYNTGVMFFRRSPDVEEVFRVWEELAPSHRSDQPTFARAMVQTGFNPFVLPRNWNYRGGIDFPQVYGPIKVWHSRVEIDEETAEKLGTLPMRFVTLADKA